MLISLVYPFPHTSKHYAYANIYNTLSVEILYGMENVCKERGIELSRGESRKCSVAGKTVQRSLELMGTK